MSILIMWQTGEKVGGTSHCCGLVITCLLSAALGRLSSSLANMPYLLLFYYPYLAYNGLKQASQSQIAPFRVRIVMSTLIAMLSIVSDTLYPINVLCRREESTPRWLPIGGPVYGEKSQKVIIHLALLAAISREILCQQKNVHSKSAQLLL